MVMLILRIWLKTEIPAKGKKAKGEKKKWAGLASALPCRLVGHYVLVLSHSYLFLSRLLLPQWLSTLLCGISVAEPSIILTFTFAF